MKFDVNIIIALIAGFATAIPLVIKLVEYVRKAIEEKNWTAIVKILTDFMVQAEGNFVDGADRKEWVMSEVKQAAKSIRYNVDMEAISALIDNLCAMAKVVNA